MCKMLHRKPLIIAAYPQFVMTQLVSRDQTEDTVVKLKIVQFIISKPQTQNNNDAN